MNPVLIVLLVILVIAAVILGILYFLGKKMQDKQAEQQAAIDAAKQTVSILVIDKKKMKMKDSGLPDVVMQNTPWYLRRAKVPLVKAKVGPQVVTLIADEKVFDLIPVKKEVKATISGLYITGVKGIRGSLQNTAPKKKQSAFDKWKEKIQEKAGAKPV